MQTRLFDGTSMGSAVMGDSGPTSLHNFGGQLQYARLSNGGPDRTMQALAANGTGDGFGTGMGMPGQVGGTGSTSGEDGNNGQASRTSSRSSTTSAHTLSASSLHNPGSVMSDSYAANVADVQAFETMKSNIAAAATTQAAASAPFSITPSPLMPSVFAEPSFSSGGLVDGAFLVAQQPAAQHTLPGQPKNHSGHVIPINGTAGHSYNSQGHAGHIAQNGNASPSSPPPGRHQHLSGMSAPPSTPDLYAATASGSSLDNRCMNGQHQQTQDAQTAAQSLSLVQLSPHEQAQAQQAAQQLLQQQQAASAAMHASTTAMLASTQTSTMSGDATPQPILLNFTAQPASQTEGTTRKTDDVGLLACAELSEAYNRITSAYQSGSPLDMAQRHPLRQQFWAAAQKLDKAFFLSPTGLGYVGTVSDSPPTRKRAFTIGSADGIDDTHKHRRTVSEALSNATSSDGPVSAGISTRSGPVFTATRPALLQHTHSSPLLPVENHYRPNSTGITEVAPSTKAADLAASGSHLVGRLSNKSNYLSRMSNTVLASDEIMSDQATSNGILPPAPMQDSDSQDATMTNTAMPAMTGMPMTSENMQAMQSQANAIATMNYTAAVQGLNMANSTGVPLTQPSFTTSNAATSQTTIDPQAYATEALRQQQVQLATAAILNQQLPPPLPVELNPSFTTTMSQLMNNQSLNAAFNQQQQPASVTGALQASYNDVDMTAQDTLIAPLPLQPGSQAPHARTLPTSMDFTSLQTVKEEDALSLTTSPYTSSHLSSISSFPFTTQTGLSGASSSRSRATSLSKATPSGSRSRAPSMSNLATLNANAPDAAELEAMLTNLGSKPSPPQEEDNNEDDDGDHDYEDGHASTGRSGAAGADRKKEPLKHEILAQFERVFGSWLEEVCADLEATDRNGEKLHQPLMAKRMQKLDEERLFRPFKFRIQPFTNSFQDACRDAGMLESDVAPKLIKQYLWNQPLISRFNDEGKKTKSKGNHVWSVEGRYAGDGRYEFRPPAPRIVPMASTASPGMQYSWTPKVLDSSCQGQPMDAEFSSPNLPVWLEFKDGVLKGVPPENALSVSVDIVADYSTHRLTQNFTIAVIGPDGVRSVAPDNTVKQETYNSHTHLVQTPTSSAKYGHPSQFSGSPAMTDLTASTSSLVTPPHLTTHQYQTSHPHISPMPAYGAYSLQQPPLAKLYTPADGVRSGPTSPVTPQHASFAAHFAPTASDFRSATDNVTLASASHIKAKLVEETLVHQEHLKVFNPTLPSGDGQRISQVIDSVIVQKLATTAQDPAKPSPTEVFNATLEISAVSSQIRQNEINNAVAAHMQQVAAVPQQPVLQQSLSSQVVNQLQDFSFASASQTPLSRSPEAPLRYLQ